MPGKKNFKYMNPIGLMHKDIRLTIALFLFICNQNLLPGQEGWKRFAPTEEKFKILAPCEMQYGEKSLLTDVGKLTTKTWMCQPSEDHPNQLYILSYVDYPEGTFHQDSTELIESLFDITISQNVRDLGGELLYQTEISKHKHPGKLYRVSYNKNRMVLKSVIYLVGDRFYALQAYAITPRSMNQEMDIFLDSIEF